MFHAILIDFNTIADGELKPICQKKGHARIQAALRIKAETLDTQLAAGGIYTIEIGCRL